MSYQRFTEGDAYVIANDPGGVFECICCHASPGTFRCQTYGEMIAHLEACHDDFGKAIARLREEASVVGMDAGFDAFFARTTK